MTRAGYGSAWSAAAKARSSAPCTASPRVWTIATSWWPARSRPIPSGRAQRRGRLHLAPERSVRRLPRHGARPKPRGPTASTSSRSSRRTICITTSACAFLDAGIHVICDKPLTRDAGRCADDWSRASRASGRLFGLTHNYTGYPMVRQAREMVAAGELGDVRVVQVEYRAGLAGRASSKRPARSRPRGAPTRSAAAPAAASATSARMRITSPSSSPACRPTTLAADLTHLRPRPAARRRRASAAALRQRRARPAVGEPGRGGQRERAARCASSAVKAASTGDQETPNARLSPAWATAADS